MKKPLPPSVQPDPTFHTDISRMEAENLANNSHKQFYVLLNFNQIKLYTSPDLLTETSLLTFLDSESTAYFLDGTFYHTHILLFSMTNSAAIVIKSAKHILHHP